MRKFNCSNPIERELWNKIKARELNSTNLTSVNLTKELHRKDKLGFFPATFVKKLNQKTPISEPKQEVKTKEEKQVNSAFKFMSKVKEDDEIVKR